MSRVEPRLSNLHPVSRAVRLHARLIAAALVGAALALALPAQWPASTRLLAAWDCGIALYLALTAILVVRADVSRLRQRAAEEDEGAIAMMVLATLAALASLGAIFAELAAAKGRPGAFAPHVALAAVTIALSWLFTHTIFAQHYANDYYGGADGEIGGLQFPGQDRPDFWDFLYFSLVIGMTSQVSDVAVTSARLRRTVTAHGVLSFVFNTTIIALTVNIASSIL
ncbi:MAG: DUF1345 domain-containing protein [Variibacter sp.]|nr:DUF1345 domain-containing protein [Variibacter sp.]